MYSEPGLLYPYFQNFSHELQQLQQLCLSHEPSSSMTSTITEYDLGGEGDLFKAPEPIEEPIISIDPVAAAISLMSRGDDIMPVEPQQSGLLSDVFYECKKDVEAAVLPLSDAKLPPLPENNEIQAEENRLPPEFSFQKSVSSGCLTAMEWLNPASVQLSFLDFSELNFDAAYGMKRSFSEGDIKPSVIGCCVSKDRMQKLSRYRNKKSRRNFGRKIKYACRKALADSQPRIRGRFARTEETDVCKGK